MKYLAVLVFCLLTIITYANDGTYSTSGSTIFPVIESDIEMVSERLSFRVQEKTAFVSIEFEFFNPKENVKILQVGFQAPSSAGDVSERQCNSPQIFDFKVQANDHFLPFELFAAECVSCELKDTSEVYFNQENNGIYVFLFNVEFHPGINVIRHSYSFPASSDVLTEEIYHYVLTTGSKWAGGMISDFELAVDMGLNSYFFVSDIFGDSAQWDVIGTGKVTDIRVEEFGKIDNQRMIRTVNGYLNIKVKNFSPKLNLEFGVMNRSSFSSRQTDRGDSNAKVIEVLMHGFHDSISPDKMGLSLQDLRIIRNTIFAQKGYNFKSSELGAYFQKFHWYMPDPNLKQEDINLSTSEKVLIQRIKFKEKSFKN